MFFFLFSFPTIQQDQSTVNVPKRSSPHSAPASSNVIVQKTTPVDKMLHEVEALYDSNAEVILFC